MTSQTVDPIGKEEQLQRIERWAVVWSNGTISLFNDREEAHAWELKARQINAPITTCHLVELRDGERIMVGSGERQVTAEAQARGRTITAPDTTVPPTAPSAGDAEEQFEKAVDALLDAAAREQNYPLDDEKVRAAIAARAALLALWRRSAAGAEAVEGVMMTVERITMRWPDTSLSDVNVIHAGHLRVGERVRVSLIPEELQSRDWADELNGVDHGL